MVRRSGSAAAAAAVVVVIIAAAPAAAVAAQQEQDDDGDDDPAAAAAAKAGILITHSVTSYEELTVLPVAISSRIRAKIMTFASTAIPIPRMIPAIPGSVRVISKAFSVISIKVV